MEIFMINRFKKRLRAIAYYTWSLFLSGLFTILPLTLTIALFHLSFKLITGWLQPIKNYIPDIISDILPYAEVIIAILIIFLIGTILRVFILRSILHSIEHSISRLPLIRPIYTGIKQLIQAFSLQDKITFKKVVYVEFPRVGIHSIGFLTSELPPEIAPHKDQKYYNVFIPTTPNPTSGYFVIAPESAIEVIDLTRQEAMAMIISGGIIQPERFEQANK
jgi:uncharacterized membrane protein